MAQENPNAREHRNFVLDGEFSPPVEPYPGAGYTVEASREDEQRRVEKVRQQELGGDPNYQLEVWMPPMPTQSPGQRAEEEEDGAFVRACQGGLPDSPPDMPARATDGTRRKG